MAAERGPVRIAAVAAAFGLAWSVSACSSPKVNEDMTDVEALAAEEAFVADTIAALPDFPGFGERMIELSDCLYGMNEDKVAEGADKVGLTYLFPEELAADTAAVESLAVELETVWRAQGYEIDYEKRSDDVLIRVRAFDQEEIVASYWLLTNPRIEVNAGGCVTIADGDFEIPEPQGGVAEENDIFQNGSSHRTDPDDWDD